MHSPGESTSVPPVGCGAGAPRALVLVGFMGAGKTTVGGLLAERLGWRFVDLDDRVVAADGRPVARIFAESGEEVFRRLETAALRDLLAEIDAQSGWVVAVGGGAFVEPQNRALLRQAVLPVAWLDAPVEELAERCRSGDPERPLARDPNQFRQLYELRRRRYMEADVRVDTSGASAGQVAERVMAALGLSAPPIRQRGC